MTKKSFKDNPTLQFISTPEEPEEQQEVIAPSRSQVEPPPEGYKINPLYVETKKRRLQLVLRPSLYDKIKSGASRQGISVNEYVHRILDKATQEE